MTLSSLMEIYADQDARLDGEPVFWLTRGREYAMKDGVLTPIYDRYIISATRVIPQPDGGLKRPYTETAYATMPDRTEVPAELESPFTGAPYRNPIIGLLRLTLWVSPAGEITQEVDLEEPRVRSSYKGKISLVNGPKGKKLLAGEFSVRAVTPTGPIELTELGPYEVDESRRADGFTPASRQIVVVRDAPAYLMGPGVTATMVGIHPSEKYASKDAVVAALTPVERERYAEWLENWERLLYAEEDVVIG